MKDWILYGYEFLTAALPAGFALWMLNRTEGTRDCSGNRIRSWAGAAFVIYLCGAFHFTGAGTLFDLMRLGIGDGAAQVNFVPFLQGIDPVDSLLNVLLFVPFGLLVPLCWPGMRGAGRMVGGGLAFSALIELSQLFNHRCTDVDDLLLNGLGALIGYGLYRICARLFRWDARPGGGAQWRLAACVLAGFAGRFLLFNEFGMAKILWGF